MKPTLKTVVVLTAVWLGTMQSGAIASQAQPDASAALNALSSGYDAQARNEYSVSDVKQFIYHWFAGFDHQQAPAYFLKHIAEPVNMTYPGFPVRSKTDFLRWYKGVTDNIVWNSHAVRNLEVSGNQASGWQVSYTVQWKAKDKAGAQYDMDVQQKMTLVREGDLLKITRLDARVSDPSDMQSAGKAGRQDTHLTALMEAAGEGDAALVKDLLEKGANLFTLDPITGTSVLHFAAQGGNVEVMKVLIQNGGEAIINLPAASNSFTPLMVATWYQNPEMIRYLLTLEHINPLMKDQFGRTAAQFPTVANGQTELHPVDKEILAIYDEYFAKRNAYIEAKFESDGITPKHLPADVNLRIPHGTGRDYHTALLVASLVGDVELYDRLNGMGADITAQGEYMKAVVAHKAGYQGHAEIMRRIVQHPDFDKIKNAQGPTNGYTPLHDAIWHGHTETARILIDAGVDTSIVAWDGMTPLDLAKKLDYTDIVVLLEKAE
ncbi:ankyrin repeat domain-containing protein [Corallincola platygyrae]|uniref:Ankyrin repeat domain-containing protein n=1 Tax=Corallincola platygyrae TaxID=1193278 RepID=A0ABW4XJW6_9GAMM